jgi:RDD family
VLLLPAMVLLDAASTSMLGTTPGKSLAGIRVRRQGRKLTFAQAMQRNFMIWWRGLACGVPLISLLTIVHTESELKEKGTTAWDAAYQSEVTGKPAIWRIYLAGALVLGGNLLGRVL